MPRYIDAYALQERLSDCEFETNCVSEENKKEILKILRIFIPQIIASEPTANVEPVKHGWWIRGVSKGFPKNPTCLWYCSCCGEKIIYNDTLRTYQKLKKPVNEVNPRCRKCGAKMGYRKCGKQMSGEEGQDNDSHIKF